MKKGISLLLIFLSVNYFAQSFTGSIEFKFYTLRDTTSNTYWVKDKKIKLDQYAKKSDNIEGSFIFNLETGAINFVNPKRKVWGDQKSEIPPVIKGKCETSKGKSKTIMGLKCTEFVVKNKDENTIISYWVTTDKFDFFTPMMELWNRKDKQSIYFNKIKGLPKGSMPVLSEERSITDNRFISKLEMTKINKGNIDDSKLEVPADYKKFEQ